MESKEIESPGKYLKAKRESKRISLREVADSTRIREAVLRAIEEDRYEDLPQLYVRSFLSAYAKNLGLDPNDLVMPPQNEFKNLTISESYVSRPPSKSRKKRSNVRLLLISILIALLSAFFVYVSFQFLPDLLLLFKEEIQSLH